MKIVRDARTGKKLIFEPFTAEPHEYKGPIIRVNHRLQAAIDEQKQLERATQKRKLLLKHAVPLMNEQE